MYLNYITIVIISYCSNYYTTGKHIVPKKRIPLQIIILRTVLSIASYNII